MAAAVLRDGGAGRRAAEATVFRTRGAMADDAAIALATKAATMTGESARNGANGGTGNETITGIGAATS